MNFQNEFVLGVQMVQKLGGKLSVQKMLLRYEFMVIQQITRITWSTVTLASKGSELCYWIHYVEVTKNVVKCRYKRNKHVHVFETCFLLRFLRRAGSPPDAWLFFKIVHKQKMKLELVILQKNSIGRMKGCLMILRS